MESLGAVQNGNQALQNDFSINNPVPPLTQRYSGNPIDFLQIPTTSSLKDNLIRKLVSENLALVNELGAKGKELQKERRALQDANQALASLHKKIAEEGKDNIQFKGGNKRKREEGDSSGQTASILQGDVGNKEIAKLKSDFQQINQNLERQTMEAQQSRNDLASQLIATQLLLAEAKSLLLVFQLFQLQTQRSLIPSISPPILSHSPLLNEEEGSYSNNTSSQLSLNPVDLDKTVSNFFT